MELTLETFLTWLLAGGGATIVVRWLVARFPALMEKLSEQERALLSGGLSAAVIAGAFASSVFLGYTPAPETTVQWIEVLFSYVATAIGLPAIMSVFMRARFEASVRRSGFDWAAANVDSNKLFGIRW